MLKNEEKNWGMACHLAAFAAFVFPTGGSILGPLIVWLMKKNESPFVDAQGKESLNFQLSIFIYLIISGLLCFVLIGFPLVFLVLLAGLILPIIGAVRASNGEYYRYPFTIRFFS